jgi:large subunit ribosomal protein L24
MSTSKIQKGDSVKVISGKYKGTTGLITKVVTGDKWTPTRVAVDAVAKIVNYQKANRAAGMPGQMTNVDRMIDSSNVQLVDSKGKVSKSFIKISDGKKVRVLKTTKTEVKKAEIAKEVKELTKK